MKLQKGAENNLRSPLKLLLITALIVPALNNLIIGWGMLFSEYFSMNNGTLGVMTRVLEVLYQTVRSAAIACTFMTIGFYAGKNGFVKGLKPAVQAILCALGAACVSVIVCALMILWGYTDASGVRSFGDKFLPYLLSALFDLLILALIEVLVALFFSMVCSLKGRSGMLSAKSPYMITAYIVFGVYTLLSMVDVFSSVRADFQADRNFFVYCVLPFVYKLIYGGVMAVAGCFFRRTLYTYFYENREQGTEETPG